MTSNYLTALAMQALGGDLEPWKFQCHAASLRIVKSGLIEDCRVARGTCTGVGGQHSWVVLGNDVYDPEAGIIDPTLWSYVDTVDGIWVGTMADGLHRPHHGWSFWEPGRPITGDGLIIELDAYRDLSPSAQLLIDMIGPLDYRGWCSLATDMGALDIGPVAKEIVEAMWRQRNLRFALPIDLVGMVTDLNPDGLYLKGEEVGD